MDPETSDNIQGQVAPTGAQVVPTRSLQGKKVSPEILKYIPQESAEYYGFVPIGIKDGVLEVGITNEDNIEARNAVSFIADKLGMPFKFYKISPEDYQDVLTGYQNLTNEVSQALGELDAELSGEDSLSQSILAEKDSNVAIIEDAPVTKIVAVIIRHAIDGNASDIHIEATGEKVRVRFRVDGILHTSLFLPANIHDSIVGRIKIITSLKLDEKRMPQDGRFSAPLDGRKVDFRVSTMPSYHGEKVVIRILDTAKGVKTLEDLGMDQTQIETVRRSISKPYGLILLTGPTGSGKSTTLYAMLNELDREKYNVISLEDPIEYNVEGVNQSQVLPEIGYTFASGLRSILRQDPDVIMVGEIRDAETAKLAIQAALTGHLVFSTLHTNNSMGVIPRLKDMGVDPYLVAPTLILAIGQRLARKACDDAREPLPIDGTTQALIDKQFADLPEASKAAIAIPSNVYRATSSALCPTGTRGRIGVFELLEIDRGIEELILAGATDMQIYDYVRSTGMLTMKDDALIKAFKGLIPFEEAAALL